MFKNVSLLWFSLISIILVVVGSIFTVFGLNILPVINKNVLLAWESSIYGAVLIGWGISLFFIGRYALIKNDNELKKYILYGLSFWLLVEAIFSFYYAVYFNIGVDIVVYILFFIPLYISFRES